MDEIEPIVTPSAMTHLSLSGLKMDVREGDRISIDGVDVIVVKVHPVPDDGLLTYQFTTRPVTDAD